MMDWYEAKVMSDFKPDKHPTTQNQEESKPPGTLVSTVWNWVAQHMRHGLAGSSTDRDSETGKPDNNI